LRNCKTKRRTRMASTPEIANEGSIPGIALGGGAAIRLEHHGARVWSVFHGGSTDFGPRPSDQGPIEHTQVRNARSPCRPSALPEGRGIGR
jgi:hypothetical protein